MKRREGPGLSVFSVHLAWLVWVCFMKDVLAWTSFEGDAVYQLEMIRTLKHRAFCPVGRMWLGICSLENSLTDGNQS